MDPTKGKSAADFLSTVPEKDLVEALATIGNEPDPWGVARILIAARDKEPILRTGQLASLLESHNREWKLSKEKNKWKSHPAIRVFQTLRILVNRELANLEHLLRILPWILKPQGVAVILSFHSGEDRLVKKPSAKDWLRAFSTTLANTFGDPLFRKSLEIQGPGPQDYGGHGGPNLDFLGRLPHWNTPDLCPKTGDPGG